MLEQFAREYYELMLPSNFEIVVDAVQCCSEAKELFSATSDYFCGSLVLLSYANACKDCELVSPMVFS